MRVKIEFDSRSVEPHSLGQLTRTIVTHLAMLKPKPLSAPYLPAALGSKQTEAKKPIQLKKKAIMNALKNMHSLPMSWSYGKCGSSTKLGT